MHSRLFRFFLRESRLPLKTRNFSRATECVTPHIMRSDRSREWLCCVAIHGSLTDLFTRANFTIRPILRQSANRSCAALKTKFRRYKIKHRHEIAGKAIGLHNNTAALFVVTDFRYSSAHYSEQAFLLNVENTRPRTTRSLVRE